MESLYFLEDTNEMRNHIHKLLARVAIMAMLVTGITLFASCGADRNIKRAEKHLALGEYHDAAEEYREAYRKTPPKEREKRGQIARKMGFCYAKTNYATRAIAAYRNAERYRQASPEDRLALARQLMKTGNYKEAEREFTVVLDSMPHDTLALVGSRSARMAPEQKRKGSHYTVRKADFLDSRGASYSPMLLGEEGRQLYFTSTRDEAEGNEPSGITGTKPGDIFLSEKDDQGKWSRPEAVTSALNTEYDEGACCFSPDGREMYLTRCVTDPAYPRYAQIVVSSRADATWGEAVPLEISRDTLSSFAHPAISPDGEWLYFISDMPGGKGGLDLWRTRLTPAGPAGMENLGEPINTPGNEMFPTFRPNGDLYFSSDGHEGLGGLDIYIAKTDPVTGRYTLSHPGYPLNSEGDDFGMTFEGRHNRGFFCSNRKDARGLDHIYTFYCPEVELTVKGWVYERDGYELRNAQVYIVGNDGTNKKVSVRADGSFTEPVSPGVDYLLMATCEGYLNHKEELSVEPTETSVEYTLQFPLASITAPVLIDNIFYDFDRATLRPESQKALDELVRLLEENPNVTIELAAHCDYKGSDEYNKRLSLRRAQAVVDYLVTHGIAADRLTPRGYGKEKPRQVSRKLAERYSWLKEGEILTEDFIRQQTPERQQLCDQLNRRTEFRVIRTAYGLFDEQGRLKELPPVKQRPLGEGEELEVEWGE